MVHPEERETQVEGGVDTSKQNHAQMAGEIKVPRSEVRGKITALLIGITLGVTSLLASSQAEARDRSAVTRLSDGQVLKGSKSEKREENNAVAALKFPKFATLQSLKNAINQRKMVFLTSGPYYILQGIGELDSKNAHFYASLRPHAKKMLDDLASKFHKIFGMKLKITSLTRTVAYVDMLRRTNGNASKTSTHMYGTTLDISKAGMSKAQIAWMRAHLAAMERSGKIVATEEWSQPCFHIVDIKANEK